MLSIRSYKKCHYIRTQQYGSTQVRTVSPLAEVSLGRSKCKAMQKKGKRERPSLVPKKQQKLQRLALAFLAALVVVVV